MTGAEIVWATLEKLGVETVFGYPGGAILPTYDALTRSKVHHVLVRHEQGASHMADGYARASGRVGVAIATSGPGATNLVTGIATAMMDSSPIVCITGQVGSAVIGTDAFQEVDITGITLPITKHNYLVTRADEIAQSIREAFEIAASDRPGPVLVDITKDAQQGKCEFNWEAAAPKASRRRPPVFFPTQSELDTRPEDDQRGRAAGDPGRARHHSFRSRAASAHAGRTREHPGGADAAGAGLLPRFAPAEPGHDGHARRGLGE